MAEAALARAVEIDPTLADAWLQLALVRLDLNHLSEAEQAARRAAESMPEASTPHETIAMALSRQGRTAEALAAIDEAVARNSLSAPAWRTRGLILNQEHRPGEAREAFLRAWELAPGDAITQRALLALGVSVEAISSPLVGAASASP
jgi:tetratricopeptide (TPR) repeat protein